jgi:membrane protease YdiL (CAAX protease family)
MVMAAEVTPSWTRRALIGFGAGFIAVVIFFQLGLLILYWLGAISDPPPDMTPTRPFGVPTLLSGAFFGGLWGILFAFLERRFPRGVGYWVASLLFGAVILDLGLWFVVAPLKGFALGFGFEPKDVAIAIFLQSVWGIGMGILYRLALPSPPRR